MFKKKKHKKKSKTQRGLDVSDCCCVEAAFDGCYVATAAHGDFDAPEVKTLRLYRDERLLVRPAGRTFSRLYYRYGRFPAALIHHVPILRAPARQVLRPAVWWARRKLG